MICDGCLLAMDVDEEVHRTEDDALLCELCWKDLVFAWAVENADA